ncbi:PREDICTED: multidrug resistance-associated protein 4-like [Acropora digitifera]|uniref:multidrug resistance-associated protein 4-like n=1 Tax=Acropora digitifera TaxID=70779 RepID=UPI00077B10D7|nr:PREDICTED: multidrug resistance-associated protein 4-like [Acropora digitifera]
MRLSGIELNAYNTFMFLAILNSMKLDVTWIIAQGAKDLADFSKALSRIQDLLEHHNIDVQKYLQDAFAKTRESQFSNECKPNTVSLQNVVCSWSGGWNRPTLKSLCLKAENGDLLFITGPVGSGKSSVFCAILNEMPLLDGEISCQGRIAWVSQQPWVFSGTVRDNILFGITFDSHKYRKTLEACDLDKDLERFPYGDMTRVGERGIVLSGGQRARVELARAVYSDADIYLLDDPLSAVDSNVGQHIFHNCINTLLNGKTRLMITHNLQVLHEAKNIFFMKNGEKTMEGSFSALLQICCDLQATSQSLETKQIAKGKNERSVREDKDKHEIERDEDGGTGLEKADEDRTSGSISWTVFQDYIRAGMSAYTAGVAAVFVVLVQGCFLHLYLDCFYFCNSNAQVY